MRSTDAVKASMWTETEEASLLWPASTSLSSNRLIRFAYEHPLVEPHVSHFSQVPFLTIVKFWHSEHMLPV